MSSYLSEAVIISVGMVLAANTIDVKVVVNVTDKPIISQVENVEKMQHIDRDNEFPESEPVKDNDRYR